MAESTGLTFRLCGPWVNYNYPISGRPDGVLVDSLGKVRKTVEVKCHSLCNYPGHKYDRQVLGQILSADTEEGILVSLVKKPGRKINVKNYTKKEACKMVPGILLDYTIKLLGRRLGFINHKLLTVEEAKRILDLSGFLAKNEP